MQDDVQQSQMDNKCQSLVQEITISQEFEMPMNKTKRFVLIPPISQIRFEDEKNRLQYYCHAKDGSEFDIQIEFENKADNASIFVSCKPVNQQLDHSKIYKLSSSIQSKKTKKQKDIKIEQKENSLKLQITQKIKEQQLCLQNEILIELAPKYNSRDEVGYTGIINNSATCYMNSVFQILFHLGIFQKLVYSIKSDQYNQFPCTLQTLFYNLRHSQIAISTQEIIKSFKWDIDQQAVQQDVQEFIMELLKAICIKVPEIEKDINHLFQGELENHIKNEKFDNSNLEQFMDISLNITNSLNESLELFIQSEQLDAYTHDVYGKQEAIKFHKFKKLPPILLINLKRYQFDGQGFTKIHDYFQYDNEINFKNYQINQIDEIYQLYAVLVHRGEAINHGHYYCYIRPIQNSQEWFKFDDKIVTRATKQEVFQNNFGGQYIQADYDGDLDEIITKKKNNPETAYMLVYIKQNQPDILISPNIFPEWIVKQEQLYNDSQFEQRHFIQTNIFTINHLNQNQCTQMKTGIIFHKQALNQSIDQNIIEEFFDQYTTPLIIPKIITIQQIIDQLSEKINVDKKYLHLLMYRISHLKPNLESIIQMQPQKNLSFYLANKIYLFGLMLISTNFEDQIIINNYFGVDKIKLDLVPQNGGKNSKENKIIVDNKVLVFIKTYSNKIIEFDQIVLLEKGQQIIDTINKEYTNNNQIKIYYQNDNLEFRLQNSIFKNTEYIQVYLDFQNEMETDIEQINNQREVIIKVFNESQCTSQLFNKNDSTFALLDFLAQLEDCKQENIQIKYKDKKGNIQILQQQMKIEELIQFDNNINYKQTIVPIGALKEQMSFQVDNQTYIILKSMNFIEFMEQELICPITYIPLLISKKDKKQAQVQLDLTQKISRYTYKHDIKFIKPIILGNDIYLICFLQSVDIVLLCNPIVCQVSQNNTIAEMVNKIIQVVSQTPIQYKSQSIQIKEDCIYSSEENKTRRLEQQIRIRINNQEVQQDTQMGIGSLMPELKQLTLVMTFLTIRDTKVDKLRQKGVQIF
ncbi:unnamed protein product [Paramecium primaurelia]|uniref:USP domain-containing protein n=1 Tax=Paramecium primaurelia TaxID=5886 RepID=A0A8S1NPY1_PARPR|nr:unnamed protein product [Paramecium primaurelia]